VDKRSGSISKKTKLIMYEQKGIYIRTARALVKKARRKKCKGKQLEDRRGDGKKEKVG